MERKEILYKKLYTITVLAVMLFICMRVAIPLIKAGFRDDWETAMQERFIFKDVLFEVYGKVNVVLQPDEVIRNGQQVVRREDGRISIPQADCSMEFQQNSIQAFSDFCEEQDIVFLYCNYPAQTGSDKELLAQGIYSYCDKRADKLIDFLRVEGIEYLDFRIELTKSSLPDDEIFYKTDHHWTTKAGFFAAKSILEKCNELGCSFDCSLLQEELFTFTKYEKCWLGETGKYVSRSWAKVLDDFVLIEPKYETKLTLTIPDYSDYDRNGDFSDLINKEIFESNANVYDSASWHYSYLFANWGYGEIDNLLIQDEGKKVLLIYDSFSLVVAPFMALTADEIILWNTRENTNSVYNYIKENDIDVAIIAYTEGSSIAKEKMFNFE